MDNSPQTPLSTIFTDRSGRPLRIFVEASNVLDRPRLIRTLRVSALLCLVLVVS